MKKLKVYEIEFNECTNCMKNVIGNNDRDLGKSVNYFDVIDGKMIIIGTSISDAIARGKWEGFGEGIKSTKILGIVYLEE